MWWKIGAVVVFILGVMAGCKVQPSGEPEGAVSSPPAAPVKTVAEAGEGEWGTSLPAAQERARAAGKTVLVDFAATWCGPCKMLEETWADPRLADALGHYITVKIDVDEQRELASEYQIQSVPTVVFLSPEGKEKHRQVGYMDAAEALKVLEQYR